MTTIYEIFSSTPIKVKGSMPHDDDQPFTDWRKSKVNSYDSQSTLTSILNNLDEEDFTLPFSTYNSDSMNSLYEELTNLSKKQEIRQENDNKGYSLSRKSANLSSITNEEFDNLSTKEEIQLPIGTELQENSLSYSNKKDLPQTTETGNQLQNIALPQKKVKNPIFSVVLQVVV